MHHASLSRKGFTLLEVIIVLFLVTLMLGLSTLFFANTLPSSRFNATVREIAATVRHAKALAVLNNESRTVTINLDSRTYGIRSLNSKSIPQDVNIKINSALSGEVSNGTYDIVFRSTGGIEGGTIVLWDARRTASIEIDPVVGAVVIK